MSETFDSVYPDLLQSGLSKLGLLDGRRELLALFASLEHFRRDLHEQQTAPAILEVTDRYVRGLNLFHTTSFWIVNPADLSFEMHLASPAAEQATLKRLVNEEIKSGRFATALRQNSETFFHYGTEGKDRGVLHALTLSSQVVGMFVGLMEQDLSANHEIHFSLLSLLLGSSADALATLHKTAQLSSQIETLSGMLPLCAWCKKVRNDKGYWEQIEKYISVRSSASFTHGVCPECQKKLLWDIKKTATA
ncbi:MAG: hypothetical protein U1F65_10570 [Verrucomicrobiota bacterium]